MIHPFTLTRLRTGLAAAVLLGAAVAPGLARAASTTVFWDQPGVLINGSLVGTGFGVSQTTAQSAQAAGIPLVPVTSVIGLPPAITIGQTLDESTLNPAYPIGLGTATVTSNWTATNTGYTDGSTTLNRYLVFEHPMTNTILVNGQPQDVTYAPTDVGLTLSNDGNGSGADWIILSLPVAGGNTLYYPAVSLGTLPIGGSSDFPLLYALKNAGSHVFQENFNYQLGMPKWSLDLASLPATVPEPSTGALMIMGLLAIVKGRRKRS
jgi:hypothetical protein